jgi:hypothetical protein
MWSPILAYPDISKKFILDCDASNEGLGAVLSQEDENGIEHPVAYHARAFSKPEKRYCVTRRELLACVGAIHHFHHYLLGARFTVRTDHNSLVWLCHFRELDGQLARWLETLAQYDFEIIHRKGRQHGNADGLSRRPCLEMSCKHCEKAELMEYSIQYVSAAVDWVTHKEVVRDARQGVDSVWEVCEEPSGRKSEVAMETGVHGKEKSGPSLGSDSSKEGKSVDNVKREENKEETREIISETPIENDGEACGTEECADECENNENDEMIPERGRVNALSKRVEGARPGACDGQQSRSVSPIHGREELISVLGSRRNIITEQRKDKDLGQLIEQVAKGVEKPKVCEMSLCSAELKRYWGQWECLKVMGGVLYRQYESTDASKKHWQVILPSSLRNEFLSKVHDDKTAGHLGIDKTRHRVQQRAYWFGWRKQVETFCKQCVLCASRKPPSRKAKAPMQKYLTGVPMERVSMDVLGPLPKSDNNNRFILLICDYFTKWVEAFPMPNQEAKTVADIFVKEFICHYGVPRKLFSDQGSNFQSKLFK